MWTSAVLDRSRAALGAIYRRVEDGGEDVFCFGLWEGSGSINASKGDTLRCAPSGVKVADSGDPFLGPPHGGALLQAVPILVIYVIFIDAREHFSRILRGSLASGGPTRNSRDFIDMREHFSRILRGFQALRSEKHRKIRANWLLQGFFNLS